MCVAHSRMDSIKSCIQETIKGVVHLGNPFFLCEYMVRQLNSYSITMIELLVFIFIDVDTRMGNFYTLKQKFNTYEQCQLYVEQHPDDRIGLTYCKPVDTDK